MDKVGVVLTCYNYGHYIGEALTSVETQTHQNWDLWLRCATCYAVFAYVYEPETYTLIRYHRGSMSQDLFKMYTTALYLHMKLHRFLHSKELRRLNAEACYDYRVKLIELRLSEALADLRRDATAAALLEGFVLRTGNHSQLRAQKNSAPSFSSGKARLNERDRTGPSIPRHAAHRRLNDVNCPDRHPRRSRKKLPVLPLEPGRRPAAPPLLPEGPFGESAPAPR